MTWIRAHFSTLVIVGISLALICLMALLYSSAEQRQKTAHQPTSVPTIPLSPPAPNYELTPAIETTDPLEATEAVRTIRETYAARAWASLVNSEDFAQYRLYETPPSSPVEDGDPRGDRVESYPVSIGPTPFTPVSVTSSENGGFVVSICVESDTQVYYPSSQTVESIGLGVVHQETFEVSPLTDAERLALAAYDPSTSLLRMRDTDATVPRVDCSTVPVITQTFAEWKKHFVE